MYLIHSKRSQARDHHWITKKNIDKVLDIKYNFNNINTILKFSIYSIYLLIGLLLPQDWKYFQIYKNPLQCLAPGENEPHQATFILLLR